jgi:hypothetical protein
MCAKGSRRGIGLVRLLMRRELKGVCNCLVLPRRRNSSCQVFMLVVQALSALEITRIDSVQITANNSSGALLLFLAYI